MDFPDAVLDEAHSFKDEIAADERKRRIDWTDKPVITIDPATAKDHDDAVFVRKLEKGGWELAVHIADVSTFVKPGSALDEEGGSPWISILTIFSTGSMLPPWRGNQGLSMLEPSTMSWRVEMEGNRFLWVRKTTNHSFIVWREFAPVTVGGCMHGS